LNIIDTLTAGFNTVTRRLWLIVVPVALDVFLWLGPKLSVAPVIRDTLATLQSTIAMMPPPAGTDASLTEAFQVMAEELQATIGQTNLLALLATSLSCLRPSPWRRRVPCAPCGPAFSSYAGRRSGWLTNLSEACRRSGEPSAGNGGPCTSA
jgi:hypothetical protein